MAKEKTAVKAPPKSKPKNIATRIAASNPLGGAAEKLAGLIVKKRKK